MPPKIPGSGAEPQESRLVRGFCGGTFLLARLLARPILQPVALAGGGAIRGIRLVDGVLYVGDQDGTVYAIER